MIGRAITVALLTGVCMVPGSAVAADGERVLSFRDPRITESSGLVDLGAVMVTSNDSGSGSRLYVVSQSTGRTVGVTDYRARTVDVEALASAGGRSVWVGDIGDNRAERSSVSVYRVKVGTGKRKVGAVRYRLAYPRGARNAESMFFDRRGRLHLVTKSIKGGTVFEAPLRLRADRVNRLARIGRVRDYATDAAMLPGRRHLLVRGPGRAHVYTFPQLQLLGGFALPRQRQGEGVSVGPGGRIRLSSEGARSAVLEISLPTSIRKRMEPASQTVTPAPSSSASPLQSQSQSPSSQSPSPSVTSSPRTGARKPDPDAHGPVLAPLVDPGGHRPGRGRHRSGAAKEVRMRLDVVRGDITDQDVEAVVNAANRGMRGGGGVDGAIHRAGGPAVLEDCHRRFPDGLATGRAGWTTAGELRGPLGDPRRRPRTSGPGSATAVCSSPATAERWPSPTSWAPGRWPSRWSRPASTGGPRTTRSRRRSRPCARPRPRSSRLGWWRSTRRRYALLAAGL